eukprot:53023-Pyramimonas_sp.AAC.1
MASPWFQFQHAPPPLAGPLACEGPLPGASAGTQGFTTAGPRAAAAASAGAQGRARDTPLAASSTTSSS